MSVQGPPSFPMGDMQNRIMKPNNPDFIFKPAAMVRKEPVVVDREKVCPLLLRVFPKIGSHHAPDEFSVKGKEPKEEIQIYTWKDATLRELTDLIKEVLPVARRKEAKLSFAFVYPNRRGRNVMRPVGFTFSQSRRSPDDIKTLAELNFQTGDFLDVSINI